MYINIYIYAYISILTKEKQGLCRDYMGTIWGFYKDYVGIM